MIRLPKLVVPYDHDPEDLSLIELAVTPRGATPADDDWRPAYRDTIDGQRVVWIRRDAPQGARESVWIRDSSGARRVTARS